MKNLVDFADVGPFWASLAAHDENAPKRRRPHGWPPAPRGPAPLAALALLAVTGPTAPALGERDELRRDELLRGLTPTAAVRLPAALQGRLLAASPLALARAMPPSPWAAGARPAPPGRATLNAVRDALQRLAALSDLLTAPLGTVAQPAQAAMSGRAAEYLMLMQDWVQRGPRTAAKGYCEGDIELEGARVSAAVAELEYVATVADGPLRAVLTSAAIGLRRLNTACREEAARPL